MSWIYFIREGETGPIKIGRSADPWKRLDALQSGNPRQLFLIGARKVGKSAHIIERDFHRTFSAHRMIGEWHGPTAELIGLANEHGLPGCDRCEAVERLHVWQVSSFVGNPEALCFRCVNQAEIDKLRAEEARAAQRTSEYAANVAANRRN